jgi:hypothetical protein
MKKLPPLPDEAFSTLGPVSVSYMSMKKAQKQGLCGVYDYTTREIKIRPEMDRRSEWVTFWHEVAHLVLMDAGAHGNTLTKEQEEVVCDAIGTHLTAMMLDGSLVVKSPATGESKKTIK